MIKMILSLFLTIGHASMPETDLQSYIASYPKLAGPSVRTAATEIVDLLSKQEETYQEFYEGPQDDGKDNPKKEKWFFDQQYEAARAQAFVREILNQPVLGVNNFTLELMKRYLDEPDSRPAIREILMAMAALKFNPAHLDQQDAARDWRPSFGKGFIIAGTAAGVFCIFRPTKCSELGRKIHLLKEAQEQITSTQSVRRSRPKPFAKQTLADMIQEEDLALGLPGRLKEETIGTRLAKKSFFKRYSEMSMKERMFGFGLTAGVGAFGGVTMNLYQKVQANYKSGKLEHEYLDPLELETKYFGALALLELSCQTRLVLADENMGQKEIENFLLGAHRELLLLGRMSGGLAVYDKTPLEFVTPLPATNEIQIKITLMDDYTFEATRKCPGVAELGSPVHVSLTELQALIGDLTLRAIGE
jgi:hypothetical protein